MCVGHVSRSKEASGVGEIKHSFPFQKLIPLSLLPCQKYGRGQDGAVFTTVQIIGPSMEPAMQTGDHWVVWRTKRLRLGDAALLQHPLRPDLLIVKRLVNRVDTGHWWVEGDNPEGSEDSRSFGPVAASAIVGRVTFRYFPLRRRM
jgi:nickel-type superoxide dismutase maturation protease